MLMDGTGINPSVDSEVANQLVDICFQLTNCSNLLDFGTGLGWMVKCAHERGIHAYGIEGASNVVEMSVTDGIYCLNICDNSTNLNKRFDVSTSFECIEHIPREYQHLYWSCVKRHSDYHFCSIHVQNEESDSGKSHSTIITPSLWEIWFEGVGIKYKRIIHQNLPKTFYCSVFYMLDMTEYNNDITVQLPMYAPYIGVINNWS